MTEGAILDTGPLVAYSVQNDDYHDWAVQTFSSLPPLFWTCEAVLTEAAYLLRSAPNAMRVIGEMLENEWLQLRFQFAPERRRVLELMDRYHAVPMSFADACLVRMAEMLDECPIVTVDRDFRIYRKHRRLMIKTIMPSD